MSWTSKHIARYFDISLSRAKLIRGVFDNRIDPLSFKRVYDQARRMYHPMKSWEAKMLAFNEILEGYGVEGFQVGGIDEWVTYVNMGDTYTPTIVHMPGGGFRYTDWGSIAEKYGD